MQHPPASMDLYSSYTHYDASMQRKLVGLLARHCFLPQSALLCLFSTTFLLSSAMQTRRSHSRASRKQTAVTTGRGQPSHPRTHATGHNSWGRAFPYPWTCYNPEADQMSTRAKPPAARTNAVSYLDAAGAVPPRLIFFRIPIAVAKHHHALPTTYWLHPLLHTLTFPSF